MFEENYKDIEKIINFQIWKFRPKLDFCDADWEECKQDILLHILKKENLYDSTKSKFTTWCYWIIRAQVINFVRNKINQRVNKKRKFTFFQCVPIENVRYLSKIGEEIISIPNAIDPKTVNRNKPNIKYFLKSLTKRENQILDLRLKLLSIKSISYKLRLSKSYIYRYINIIKIKYIKSLSC